MVHAGEGLAMLGLTFFAWKITNCAQAKSDKLQVLLKSTVEGVGKANQVVQVRQARVSDFHIMTMFRFVLVPVLCKH
jgi:hypothetical protein